MMRALLLLLLTLGLTAPTASAQDTDDSGGTASDQSGDPGGAPSCAVIPPGGAVVGLVLLSLALGRRKPDEA